MSSVVFNKQNIQSLIEHHIALLNRFNITEDNEFSVIYFNIDKLDETELSVVFQKLLRQTDALFHENTDILVMLPGTNWNGATELLSGIQEFLNQPLMDNIVTYPDDGDNAKDLLFKLNSLIKENCNKNINLI